MPQGWDAQHVEAVACEAVEEFLTGRLEKTLSAHRGNRGAHSGANAAGEALASLHSQDLAAWQEHGYLSHVNAAAVIGVYYERRIAQAARDLRQSGSRPSRRRDRARSRYHQLRHEKAAVETWLEAQGWDLRLESADSESEAGVVGTHWKPGPP